ncbi:MAG: thioredoxin [Clostridia bacterium]|nr:thioredoxin [Clostridia bacterium]
MSVLKLTDDNFENQVLRSSKNVVVDFYADWCGPCKMMSPIIENVAEELEGKAIVGKVNVDENSGVAEKYGIMSIPTIIIFKNGEVYKIFTGVTSKSEIMEAIN